jgi:RNA polymerase sigma factor (sigma-70 family)
MSDSHSLSVDTELRRRENELYKSLYPRFVDFYSAHVRKYALAKELAAVAIGKVMTKLDSYDSRQPLENWAMRVARNYLIDYYRQRASRKNQLVTTLGGLQRDDYDLRNSGCSTLEGCTEPDQEYALLTSELLAQLKSWPGDEGEAVRAHFLGGATPGEISEQLDLPEKRIKIVLAQARALLQTQILGLDVPVGNV